MALQVFVTLIDEIFLGTAHDRRVETEPRRLTRKRGNRVRLESLQEYSYLSQ